MNTMKITVEEEGFYGLWHKADTETDSKKALIVIGGSEGNENIPMNVGRMFAERGISTLGMCYFNVPGLPDNLIRVPVDPFEKAVAWLKDKGYEKILHLRHFQGRRTGTSCGIPDFGHRRSRCAVADALCVERPEGEQRPAR